MREIVVSGDDTRGMTTVVRWARSRDGCALLVVEDPAGVEAEPLPDVAWHVRSARGVTHVVRIDSLWDVAPDSAWRRLVVGRAHVARGNGTDTLPTSAWATLARTVGRPVADVRGAAFSVSGMSVAMSVAQPAWADVSGADGPPRWHVLPMLAGWRVRWAPDDTTLLVGSAPRRVHDDAPAGAWLRVGAVSGAPRGTPLTLAGDPAGVAWRSAPPLDAARVSRDTLAATEDRRVVLVIEPRPAGLGGASRARVVLGVRGYRPM